MPIIHFYSQCSTLLITGYANPAENNALWQLTASVSSRVYPSRRGVSLQETREVLGKAYPCYLYIPHHDAGVIEAVSGAISRPRAMNSGK